MAVNRFATDSDAEIEMVRQAALEAGAFAAVEANHWALGGAGAVELARSVVDACAAARKEAAAGGASTFKYLYPLTAPIKDKIERVAKEIYGAAAVVRWGGRGGGSWGSG